MGLAGPRKRTKITHDPNNTEWTRKKGFGHNLLVSQGWSPGQTLGAQDAAHADSYTAGSHGHIRMLLREDNLGLGARYSGYQNGTESTGLDAFQGILGRLNGKSDDVLAKEQRSRDDARRHMYADRKWGSLRFVNGGTLQGADLSSLVSTKIEDMEPEGKPTTSQSAETQEAESTNEDGASALTKKERKEAKRKRKAEKAQRKLEKAQRKAAQVLSRESKASSVEPQAQASISGTASPIVRLSRSGTSSRTESPSGRQAVRQRYIQQKRMAFTDAKALKEVRALKIGVLYEGEIDSHRF